MVYYYTLSSAPDITCYVGKDKYENEELIKLGWEEDVWFHVDDYSSAHAYIRLPSSMYWDNLPEAIITEVCHLVKLNSITGNKLPDVNVIYTPWRNLKKTPGSDIGAVTFHDHKMVKKVRTEGRRKDLTNPQLKTRREEEIQILRDAKKADEMQRIRKANEELKQQRKAEEERKKESLRLKEEKNYVSLMRNISENNVVDEDDFM